LTRLTALGLPAALPSHLRVAAVGAATAHELGSRGVPIHLVPAEGTAARLAVHMVGAGAGGTRILLPVGNLARPHLRRGLEEAGAQVDQVVAYRTVRPAEVDEAALEAVRRGDIDAVALASPSAIRHLVDLLGPHASCLQKARLACIGPTTAAEVRELGLEPSAVAGEHTLQGLVQAIASLFGERADEPI
jgi:uroporphyrinogen-III synthase